MFTPKDLYLVAYNLSCCTSWAVVWGLTVAALSDAAPRMGIQTALAQVATSSPDILNVLTLAQGAAILEIVHAAMRLVRSPVLVTAMQVGSRLVALLALLYSPKAQAQFGAGVMLLSWASVEVPRYLFYVLALLTGDATKKTPYPLFWLRYSLFAVLYPTGICGELTVFWAAAHDEKFHATFNATAAWYLYARVLPVVYVFGSPFMIMNMVANRKSAFKKRFAKPAPPAAGLVWPLDARGERSSTNVNKAIVSAAVGAVDSKKAALIDRCKNWRFNYGMHLRGLVEAQCQSPEAALKVAQAGLDKAYEMFEFINSDGSAESFGKAMAKQSSSKFYTGYVKGEGRSEVNELLVPYRGSTRRGAELRQWIDNWVAYGTIEPSAGEAMKRVLDNPKWCDVKDRYFVLLGAGSAMGPLLVLLALGANVVAIDLDRPPIWERLIKLARDSTGSLTFPVKVDPKSCDNDKQLAAVAGCNLFTHTPTIRDWLVALYPGKSLTVGSYAYLDGALHVQVSLAMDSITRALSEQRKNTSLAYLCTPTDLHLVPEEAHAAMEANYQSYKNKPYCMLMRLLSNGNYLRKNATTPIQGGNGERYYLVNGISVAQGPNYALAKRLQHWRAIVARSKGCVVSSNVAPSTSTVSVVHNRTFAWAYEGMPYFKPFEIFAPETSNAVMSALLLHDLNEPKSVANPRTKINNPNQLFSYGSFHGGVWRCAYEVDSIGEASVFLYFGRVAKPWVAGIVPIALAAGAYWYGYNH